jgi:hypothetical protein
VCNGNIDGAGLIAVAVYIGYAACDQNRAFIIFDLMQKPWIKVSDAIRLRKRSCGCEEECCKKDEC